LWQKGWPLALCNTGGALVLHLGAIDESLVRPHDIYLCIRSCAADVSAALYACWRAAIVNESAAVIVYRQLDPDKDPITPLSVEMLAGEDLPHLLQTLLVGVEHAICRIPLDELTFPPHSPSPPCDQLSNSDLIDCNSSSSKQCNLKRRELITKNNSINKKYAIKRTSCSNLSQSEQQQVDESETASAAATSKSNDVSITPVAAASTTSNNLINETNPMTTTTTTTTTTSSSAATTSTTQPLFCLGGSFPHIDSDEESGDDAKKIQSGELLLNEYEWIVGWLARGMMKLLLLHPAHKTLIYDIQIPFNICSINAP